jgi:SAM-dependent methyltransferase
MNQKHQSAPLAGDELRRFLREFYGKVVEKTSDLKSKSCCADNTAARYSEIVRLLPEEVRARNYGCGSSLPEDDLGGLHVLDLGSGAGLDAFIAAKLVGPRGFVTGVDMTDEQLEVARRGIAPAMAAFGHETPNVRFLKGFIETADGVEDGSIDLVISDCTINLSPLKEAVLRTIHRVLRAGGEMYVSDIVADRRVPERIRRHPQMVAECLGGALYENDWVDLLEDCGFRDARVVSRRQVEEDVLGEPIRFFAVTTRAFKFEEPLDRRCEDYGQTATYRGSILGSPARYALDDHHLFEAHRPSAVCRNTARMLAETRLARHFDVTPALRHFGLFPCGPGPAGAAPASGPACC